MSNEKVFDVVGLGNALVDALVRMDERELLEEFGYTRGHMTPVSDEQWHAVRARVEAHGVELQSGGSCANTIVALGLMGAQARYCGQVGHDELGDLYAKSLQDACGGHALHWTQSHETGKCLSIVSASDAERTMLSDLGAAVHLDALGDFEQQIKQAKVLHLTGYLLLGEPMVSRVNEAIAIAKESGCLVSLDVADPFVIGLVSDAMWELIERHADIVFLNREEAQALCGDELEQLSRLESHARTIIIKLGAEGSLVRHDGEEIRLSAHPVQAVDTTGAGDSYAAGFLYGHVQQWPIASSAELGGKIAAMTVGQLGAVVRDRDRVKAAVRECAPHGAV